MDGSRFRASKSLPRIQAVGTGGVPGVALGDTNHGMRSVRHPTKDALGDTTHWWIKGPPGRGRRPWSSEPATIQGRACGVPENIRFSDRDRAGAFEDLSANC
jgi:hypothetical protein